jgi:carbonic anhydrase/acetyltransferase-like protein (isoleucine patch superfamily)
VAEGSVVKLNQKIPDKVVVAGNPARVVRAVTDQDEKMWAFGKQIYIDLAAKYLEQGMIPVS